MGPTVDLYQLLPVRRPRLERQDRPDDGWLDAVRWVKRGQLSANGLHSNASGKPVRSNGHCQRFQSLLCLKKCFTRGMIMLDVEANDFQNLISQHAEEPLAARMGIEKRQIAPLFQQSRFVDLSDARQLSSISLLSGSSKQSGEISCVSIREFQQSRRAQQAEKRSNCFLKKFKKAFSNLIAASTVGDNDQDLDDCERIFRNGGCRIFVAVMKTAAKLQMVLLRPAEKSSSAVATNGNKGRSQCALFAFIVGPPTPHIDYDDLGRCCMSMFSNQLFVDIMNNSPTVDQFLIEIDRLLNHVVVIAPGPACSFTPKNLNNIRRVLSETFSNWSSDNRRRSTDSENSLISLNDYTKKNKTEEMYNPLKRTGQLFHGLINDIRFRYQFYASDFTNAFRGKCLMATILTFFNTFTSAIALSEVLSTKTKRWMGLSEVLVAQCICGLIWGLFAGQPLIIQTTTAAFVMFEGSLYKFCDAHGLEYLVIRAWTGGWILLLTFFMVMLETPFLIRYVTRFTEEVFDTLISVAFVYESLLFLFETFEVHPLRDLASYCSLLNSSLVGSKFKTLHKTVFSNLVKKHDPFEWNVTTDLSTSVEHPHHRVVRMALIDSFEDEFHYDHGDVTQQPNCALLTLILMMSTFFLSLYIDSLRRSVYFGRTVREMIGSFSVPIVLLTVAFLADMLFKSTHILRVHMTMDFSATEPSKRGWFINPFGVENSFPIWAMFASIAPAFLVSILLFVELELAEFGFAQKDKGLRKGGGFHMDLLLTGLSMFVCGLMGLPWLGAGPVQSRAHLATLTVRERAPPGEEAKIDQVIEQRMTTIGVAVLLGACAFLGRALVRIPVPVLMGVLVYLGVRSLCEIQFVRRVVLYIVPRKYYPDAKYCQQVSMWRMHFFTAVQILCFGVLFTVEVLPQISVVFPFIVTMICVFRHIFLPLLFKRTELDSLDSATEESDEEDIFDHLQSSDLHRSMFL